MSLINSILAITGGGKPQPERPYIIPLDQYNGDAFINAGKRYFQYWPEEISDTKQTNWETKNIPGLSHPIYQWISGGAREIGFTAMFTRDAPLSASDALAINDAQARMSESGFISVAPIGATKDNRNIDIPSAVAWLRSFEYPDYSQDGLGTGRAIRAKPPQKLILGLPGMKLNHSTNASIQIDQMVCIMTQCDVSYTGFFADGSPRIAKVALQFAETVQYQGRINQVDAFAVRSFGLAGYGLTQTTRDKTK